MYDLCLTCSQKTLSPWNVVFRLMNVIKSYGIMATPWIVKFSSTTFFRKSTSLCECISIFSYDWEPKWMSQCPSRLRGDFYSSTRANWYIISYWKNFNAFHYCEFDGAWIDSTKLICSCWHWHCVVETKAKSKVVQKRVAFIYRYWKYNENKFCQITKCIKSRVFFYGHFFWILNTSSMW